MKKILFPTDLSELSGYAYNLAHKLAAATGAEIHAYSIIPTPPRAVFDHDGNLKDDSGTDYSDWYRRREEREKQLTEWAAEKPDIVRQEVKIGRVKQDILHYVETHEIDLVVMGTAGALGLDEMLRGTHTEYIVSHSPVPVMCLKCDRSDLTFEDILIVSDFSDEKAIDFSVIKTIQKTFDSTIHLLKVNTRSAFETSQKTHERMEKFVEVNGLPNTQKHIYNDEEVEKGIVNFCADSGIDFIAIGTHQRSGLSRLFNHSISEEVVNHIYQPILCYPVA